MAIKYVPHVDNGPIGFCNLCQTKTKLTEEHIPPRKTLEHMRLTVRNLFATYVGSDAHDGKEVLTQKGAICVTTCSTCNGKLSGYDKALKRLVDRLRNRIRIIRNLHLSVPNVLNVRCQPVAVSRSVLGHLVAAEVVAGNTRFDQAVREWVFDEQTAMPAELHLYYWFYPYNHVVVAPELPLLEWGKGGERFGTIYMLTVPPIAFVATNDWQNLYGLHDLGDFRQCGTYDEADMPLRIDVVKHPFWPATVEANRAVTMTRNSQNSIFGLPRLTRSQ